MCQSFMVTCSIVLHHAASWLTLAPATESGAMSAANNKLPQVVAGMDDAELRLALLEIIGRVTSSGDGSDDISSPCDGDDCSPRDGDDAQEDATAVAGDCVSLCSPPAGADANGCRWRSCRAVSYRISYAHGDQQVRL